MEYVKQFCIIILISFMGETLNNLIPLPIPASIYGLIILFLALKLEWVRLEQIQATANFLLETMILMFVPAAVGLMVIWPAVQSLLVPLVVIAIVTTILVLVITGWVAQVLYRQGKKVQP